MASLEKVTVPSQDGVWTYQQQEVPQLVHREVVEQAGEDGAVGGGERGFADLTLQDQQLVAQRQDLDVLVVLAHRQKAQECQGVGRGEIGQAQQHERIMMVYAPVHVKRLGGLGHGQRSAVKAATWADDFSAPAMLQQHAQPRV
ncbi:hypothetical protein AB5J72_37685 [Streptomyces sp. CG1]|uniref:hypothetical protein n=1 Tax=Streptomyces sp. CG1 TaxID=1287523 RepID=UPI0034E2944E